MQSQLLKKYLTKRATHVVTSANLNSTTKQVMMMNQRYQAFSQLISNKNTIMVVCIITFSKLLCKNMPHCKGADRHIFFPSLTWKIIDNKLVSSIIRVIMAEDKENKRINKVAHPLT